MCRPKSQGGQRCYGAASKRYAAAEERLTAATPAAGARSGLLATRRLEKAQRAFEEAAIDLASTAKGQQQILDLAAASGEAGEHARAGMFLHLASAGKHRREMNDAVKSLAVGRAGGSLTTPAPTPGSEHTADDYYQWARTPDDDDPSDTAYEASVRAQAVADRHDHAADPSGVPAGIDPDCDCGRPYGRCECDMTPCLEHGDRNCEACRYDDGLGDDWSDDDDDWDEDD